MATSKPATTSVLLENYASRKDSIRSAVPENAKALATTYLTETEVKQLHFPDDYTVELSQGIGTGYYYEAAGMRRNGVVAVYVRESSRNEWERPDLSVNVVKEFDSLDLVYFVAQNHEGGVHEVLTIRTRDVGNITLHISGEKAGMSNSTCGLGREVRIVHKLLGDQVDAYKVIREMQNGGKGFDLLAAAVRDHVFKGVC